MNLTLFETEQLTVIERSELDRHEETIERGLQTFVEVGNALMAIRDNTLYRETHRTFEDYCRERWGFTDERARLLMRGAQVVSNLTPTEVGVLPTNERQTRPLIGLTPEQQRAAWQEVVETAPDGKITGPHVASVAERYKAPAEPESEPDDDEPPYIPPVQPNRAYKNSSESNEWYTPRYLIDKAMQVMGDIDLDPATSETANRTVQAAHIYTIEDDALTQNWYGRVWINPPYGRDVDPFVEKLVSEYGKGSVKEALMLVAARTDTAWFRRLRPYPRCFLWGRVKFINGETGEIGDPAGFPSMVVYMGADLVRFAEVFEDIGDIYIRWQ